jgi:succinate dehydrogenase/fumarate reductase flavoprotein subunit
MARNQHELMHCLEVLNLMDLGEVILTAANERKESRSGHVRSDCPYTNPLLNKLLVAKKIDGKIVLEWKGLKR